MFSLLSLLDDVATTLDDVAAMSKVALSKTSALMSDDLAVNAGVVVGVKPERELPIVKAIFIKSLYNKVYCIAAILILMAVYPPLILGIMFIGGVYLCFEGAHKIFEKLSGHSSHKTSSEQNISEKQKINGAAMTDLILSMEIIVIAQSTLTGDLSTQILSLIVVGLAASILIYGLVAVIVKVDDFGLHLIKSGYEKIGSFLVNSMPYTMKSLGIIGTTAMLLVGGGIFVHIFHLPVYINEHLQNLVLGLVVGFSCVALWGLKNKLKGSKDNQEIKPT